MNRRQTESFSSSSEEEEDDDDGNLRHRHAVVSPALQVEKGSATLTAKTKKNNKLILDRVKDAMEQADVLMESHYYQAALDRFGSALKQLQKLNLDEGKIELMKQSGGRRRNATSFNFLWVACHIKAARCCSHLEKWKETYEHAKEAVDGMGGLDAENDEEDDADWGKIRVNQDRSASSFAEWRVKGAMLMARALARQSQTKLAIAMLGKARAMIRQHHLEDRVLLYTPTVASPPPATTTVTNTTHEEPGITGKNKEQFPEPPKANLASASSSPSSLQLRLEQIRAKTAQSRLRSQSLSQMGITVEYTTPTAVSLSYRMSKCAAIVMDEGNADDPDGDDDGYGDSGSGEGLEHFDCASELTLPTALSESTVTASTLVTSTTRKLSFDPMTQHTTDPIVDTSIIMDPLTKSLISVEDWIVADDYDNAILDTATLLLEKDDKEEIICCNLLTAERSNTDMSKFLDSIPSSPAVLSDDQGGVCHSLVDEMPPFPRVVVAAKQKDDENIDSKDERSERKPVTVRACEDTQQNQVKQATAFEKAAVLARNSSSSQKVEMTPPKMGKTAKRQENNCYHQQHGQQSGIIRRPPTSLSPAPPNPPSPSSCRVTYCPQTAGLTDQQRSRIKAFVPVKASPRKNPDEKQGLRNSTTTKTSTSWRSSGQDQELSMPVETRKIRVDSTESAATQRQPQQNQRKVRAVEAKAVGHGVPSTQCAKEKRSKIFLHIKRDPGDGEDVSVSSSPSAIPSIRAENTSAWARSERAVVLQERELDSKCVLYMAAGAMAVGVLLFSSRRH